MKEDRDLLFLQQAKNEDLKTLVDILTHDIEDASSFCFTN
ncbi:DUF3944 domain-containing protein [Mediterranea massiliensis]